MGNKHSRSKSTSYASTGSPKRRKKERGSKKGSVKSSGGKDEIDNKHKSMPDLPRDKKEEDVKVTMYRSYRDLDRSKSSLGGTNERVDYRLYRRSTGAIISDQPRTLPRNFGRSKSSAGHPVRDAYTPNGSIDPGFPGLDPRDRTNSTGKGSFKSSKRASRASSYVSNASQFLPTDFPSTEEVKSKLSKFEEVFTRKFVSKFTDLPEEKQISVVVIAREPSIKNRRISLKEYMAEGTIVPDDLLTAENLERYRLSIPESLFHGIRHVRREKQQDQPLIASLARDVVSCIATEAANELTRIYEYQVALMYDELSIRIIADHAAECIIEYIQGHYLDRNSAIRSVIQIYPPNPDGSPKYISGVIGTKELKWDLFEIFKKPGVRKEQLLISHQLLSDHPIDCQPWQYHYAEDTDPFLYGYRGQMIEWDFSEKVYRLDMKENERFNAEIAFQVEDFHRMYMPYKRLVGLPVMAHYCSQLTEQRSLAEVVKADPLEGPPERDEILPVYRPLSKLKEPISYNKANLDNTDLTRAQMADTDLSRARVQNSKLLMANLDNTKLSGENMAGCDLSYSNLEASVVGPDDLKQVKARHVLLNESFSCSTPVSPDSPDGQRIDVASSPNAKAQDEDAKMDNEESPSGDTPLVNGVENGNEELVNGRDSDQPLANGGAPDGDQPLTNRNEPEEDRKLNMSVVSDAQGHVMPLSEAINQQIARVQEEDRIKAIEAEKTAAAAAIQESPQQSQLPTITVNGQEAGKKSSKRKKKKKGSTRVEELSGVKGELNQSVESAGQGSVTDYNFLDNSRGQSSQDRGQSPVISKSPGTVGDTNGHINDDQVTSFFSSNDPPAVTSTPNSTAATARRPNDLPEEIIRPNKARNLEYYPPAQSQTDGRSSSSSNILSEDTTGYSRPIGSRYSTVEKRPERVRIVKSHSLHGHLTTAGKGGRSLQPHSNLLGKQLSPLEGEYIRRSQLFRMLSVLQAEPLSPMLPSLTPDFMGRGDEVLDIADLLNASGRIITLTGCPGVGKSSLAVAVGREMVKKLINPVYINAATCTSVDSLLLRLMSTFHLSFKASDLPYFYQWMNTHEQRLLFIFDNVELDCSLDNEVSEFLDNLLFNVKNLRVLSTSHRQYFRGNATHETYRVGDVRQFSEAVLRQVIPDCHDEGISDLINAVDHTLFGLHLCGRAFAISDVDSGKLFEDLASPQNCQLISKTRLEDSVSKFTTSEIEQQRVYKLGLVVAAVMEHLSAECRDVLSVVHVIPSEFSAEIVGTLLSRESDFSESLNELVRIGLLTECRGVEKRYCLSRFVRLVAQTCWPDDGSHMLTVAQYYVDQVKSLNTQYHSCDALKALMALKSEYDNVVVTLRWLIEREDVYQYCASFSDSEFAIFLSDILPKSIYEDLYESLSQQAEENDDVITRTGALCCSSYKCMQDAQFDTARVYAENAYELLHTGHVTELDKAFCVQCLGKAYWWSGDMKEKGLTLVKCSLDIYKASYGLKHVKALYANEEYGKLLTEKDQHQKARHIFNVSDLILTEMLDRHPMLIQGYDCRREIWDKLYLFSRSTEIAQKAVDTAKAFYGDHPITAETLTKLGQCIMKRGSLQEGLKVAIEALSIRIRVLGDHLDTGLSYKMLAYLMMRSGQHEEAIKYAQGGLDVYEKIDAAEKYKIEVKNIVSQARYKLESRPHSTFVEIDSRNASKTNVTEVNVGRKQSTSNGAVSTAV